MLIMVQIYPISRRSAVDLLTNNAAQGISHPDAVCCDRVRRRRITFLPQMTVYGAMMPTTRSYLLSQSISTQRPTDSGAFGRIPRISQEAKRIVPDDETALDCSNRVVRLLFLP